MKLPETRGRYIFTIDVPKAFTSCPKPVRGHTTRQQIYSNVFLTCAAIAKYQEDHKSHHLCSFTQQQSKLSSYALVTSKLADSVQYKRPRQMVSSRRNTEISKDIVKK
jgi:hypothetical protein